MRNERIHCRSERIEKKMCAVIKKLKCFFNLILLILHHFDGKNRPIYCKNISNCFFFKLNVTRDRFSNFFFIDLKITLFGKSI